MNVQLDVQYAVAQDALPDRETVRTWLMAVLELAEIEWRQDGELTIGALGERGIQLTVRLVDREESAKLNYEYRHKDGPTNVLSFPYDQQIILEPVLLGDIVICAPLVPVEAQQQNKSAAAHWAHLVVHGFLHLLGYDHESAADADIMETVEVQVLQRLGLPDPYADQHERVNGM